VSSIGTENWNKPRLCSVSIRVYPSWHMLRASEIAVFTVSDEAVFAETLFGTLNGTESSSGRAVNIQIPAKWPLATLIPVFRSNATHGPGRNGARKTASIIQVAAPRLAEIFARLFTLSGPRTQQPEAPSRVKRFASIKASTFRLKRKKEDRLKLMPRQRQCSEAEIESSQGYA
jgi:hypothetical protein